MRLLRKRQRKTEEILRQGLTGEDAIRGVFIARQTAVPLLGTFLGTPVSNVSDQLVSGVLSVVARGLQNDNFSIARDVDGEFINALLGSEQDSIKAIIRDIARSADFSNFLFISQISGEDSSVEGQIEMLTGDQQGLLTYLANSVWRMKKDKGMTNDEAIRQVGARLTDIKGFLAAAGLDSEEYVNEIIADSRKMGKWSYYLDLTQPLSQETKDLDKALDSKSFATFFERYNNSVPGIDPRNGKQTIDPQMLTLQFGRKLDWTENEWATFKVLIERYLGRELFTSKEWVQVAGEEGQDITTFLNNYLNSSVLGVTGYPGYAPMASGLDPLTFQKWAVIVDTFGEGDTIEAKWQNFIEKLVNIRNEMEPLMKDYFGEDKPYDPYNPIHSGVLTSFVEKIFNMMFLNSKDAGRQRGWLVGPKGEEENINPYEQPDEFLLKAKAEVMEDLKTAIELKPYVEASRMTIIDVTDPKLSGVLWFHVETLKYNPERWEQFRSKEALISHLKEEAKVSFRLAQSGRYLDMFDPDAMGALSYAAQNPRDNEAYDNVAQTAKSVFLGGPLTPENAIISLAYYQFSKLLFGQTDNSQTKLAENKLLIVELLNANPYWKGWDNSVTGELGFDYSLMSQIRDELGVAATIKEDVARFFGVREIDFRNPEHMSMLWEYTHRAYEQAKTELDKEVAAGRIAEADKPGGWSLGYYQNSNFDSSVANASKRAMTEYGLNDLAAPMWGQDLTPYRFWLLEMAGKIEPQIKEELDILKSVQPLVELLHGKLDLSVPLDMRLLNNYKDITISLGAGGVTELKRRINLIESGVVEEAAAPVTSVSTSASVVRPATAPIVSPAQTVSLQPASVSMPAAAAATTVAVRPAATVATVPVNQPAAATTSATVSTDWQWFGK
ncbi:MAG: hypothetical protein NTZ48_02710, partial [Candidatus Omnitrophica bacterium]|nr:hypothetical protein [Candidatus Omnitrophota bacterium]